MSCGCCRDGLLYAPVYPSVASPGGDFLLCAWPGHLGVAGAALATSFATWWGRGALRRGGICRRLEVLEVFIGWFFLAVEVIMEIVVHTHLHDFTGKCATGSASC